MWCVTLLKYNCFCFIISVCRHKFLEYDLRSRILNVSNQMKTIIWYSSDWLIFVGTRASLYPKVWLTNIFLNYNRINSNLTTYPFFKKLYINKYHDKNLQGKKINKINYKIIKSIIFFIMKIQVIMLQDESDHCPFPSIFCKIMLILLYWNTKIKYRLMHISLSFATMHWNTNVNLNTPYILSSYSWNKYK